MTPTKVKARPGVLSAEAHREMWLCEGLLKLATGHYNRTGKQPPKGIVWFAKLKQFSWR